MYYKTLHLLYNFSGHPFCAICSEIQFSSGKVALLADGAVMVQVPFILMHMRESHS